MKMVVDNVEYNVENVSRDDAGIRMSLRRTIPKDRHISSTQASVEFDIVIPFETIDALSFPSILRYVGL